jgi:hypothetical protein
MQLFLKKCLLKINGPWDELHSLVLKSCLNWAWRFMPVISAVRRLRQEDPHFEANLGCIVRLCLIKQMSI